MSEESNLQVIQQHITAFGCGDVEGSLAFVAEQVDWQSPATDHPPVEMPWSTPRHNRSGVRRFFQEMPAVLEMEAFDIRTMLASGDTVVVEGGNRGRVRSTGTSYEHDWVMVFTLEEGKIVRYRHYYDPEDVLVAFRS